MKRKKRISAKPKKTHVSVKPRQRGRSVTLIVSLHASGNYTLMEQYAGKRMPRDLIENKSLFTNSDKGEFYRAVAKEIAKRVASGEKITYDDWPE